MNEEVDQTKKVEEISSPAEDLKQTTNDLIKDSLANAKSEDKAWYERVGYYIGAIVLAVVYYVGDQFGSDIVNKIVEVVKALLG